MAVWAIGDIQGCYKSFRELLEKIDFDPAVDKLWVAGDLVNRGEGSLETLEYLYSIKESVEIILGRIEPLSKFKRFLKTVALIGEEQIEIVVVVDLWYSNGIQVIDEQFNLE